MTRMKLNPCGRPKMAKRFRYWTTFKFLLVLVIISNILDQILSTLTDPYVDTQISDDGAIIAPPPAPGWAIALVVVRLALQLVFYCYVIVLMMRTRAYIRQRFAIPEHACRGCEDCCYAVFLPICTVTQMARHTADYDITPAACCTDTGLSEQEQAMI